jgi:hypothetical protein
MATATKKPRTKRPPKSPEGAAPAAGSVLVVRSRDIIKAPPGPLGFSHLLVPDTAFEKSVFNANVHYTDPAFNALAERINEAYWSLIPELLDKAVENKVAGSKKGLTAEDHRAKVKVLSKADLIQTLKDKLKDAKEGDLIQLPHFVYSCNSSYHDHKKGVDVPITVKAFDPHGAPIDLKTAKMGRESIVMAMFTVGVWAGASPFSKWVALPTIRFMGLQVLKLKQYGGGQGPAAGEVSAADLKFLEDDFQVEDLSMFTKPAEAPAAKGKAPVAEDFDDEIPF